ncbi:unnamed protein product [Amoebophrya sp. A25]|nr:unnamed protein product [Amoebophrya sp. A25]|eukprot:GSA25T00021499001.1
MRLFFDRARSTALALREKVNVTHLRQSYEPENALFAFEAHEQHADGGEGARGRGGNGEGRSVDRRKYIEELMSRCPVLASTLSEAGVLPAPLEAGGRTIIEFNWGA